MKAYWERQASRIDALSLRERAMLFAIAALLVTTAVNTFVLDPLLSTRKQRAQQIKLDQQQIAAAQAEIKIIIDGHEGDPDAANRARLQMLKQQSEQLRADLTVVQQSLVTPDKMVALLDELLKKNKQLQLVSLKTLPTVQLFEPDSAAAKKADVKPSAAGWQEKAIENGAEGGQVYKHGVELVVQGGYADIVNYLSQLEGLPWRLFWAKAKLSVEEHPKVRLTLTLFTLSLDKAWLNI